VDIIPRFSNTGRGCCPTAEGPDLQHVGVFGDQVHVLGRDDLRDDLETGALACLGQQFKAFLPQTLEAVRRRSRLEGAPAENSGARFSHRHRRRQDLVPALNRARPRHNDDLPATDHHVVHLDPGGVRLVGPGHQRVRGSVGPEIGHSRHLPERIGDRFRTFAHYAHERSLARFTYLYPESRLLQETDDVGLGLQ
jgi:hypothetical protein